MAQISKINYSSLNEYLGRIDAEFYKPASLLADNTIKNQHFKLLGNLVQDGYRVVYGNTKILRTDKVDFESDVRFLQATNISNDGLWIETKDIGFVSQSDWFRYPKGRIKHGEILIEVKGLAEKVTIVQDYLPIKTLVTGTLFKLTLKDNSISHEYLFAFFSSKYGKILRDRTKVNTLIAYVSKPELYKIPIPIFSKHDEINISKFIEKSFFLQNQSQLLYKQATDLLNKELGLDKIVFENKKNYTARFSEVISNRIDAEFFNQELLNYYSFFKKSGKELIPITELTKILKFSNPDYSKEGAPIITQRHLSSISPENYGDFPIASLEWLKKNPAAVIREDDLLFYSVGAYLGKTNIWFNEDHAVHASFITMLRCENKYDAGYLMVLLNSKYGILQSKVYQSGSSQPYIYPKDIKQFLVPKINEELKMELYRLIKESFNARKESKRLLEHAKLRVEELIEEAANKQ